MAESIKQVFLIETFTLLIEFPFSWCFSVTPFFPCFNCMCYKSCSSLTHPIKRQTQQCGNLFLDRQLNQKQAKDNFQYFVRCSSSLNDNYMLLDFLCFGCQIVVALVEVLHDQIKHVQCLTWKKNQVLSLESLMIILMISLLGWLRQIQCTNARPCYLSRDVEISSYLLLSHHFLNFTCIKRHNYCQYFIKHCVMYCSM